MIKSQKHKLLSESFTNRNTLLIYYLDKKKTKTIDEQTIFLRKDPFKPLTQTSIAQK